MMFGGTRLVARRSLVPGLLVLGGLWWPLQGSSDRQQDELVEVPGDSDEGLSDEIRKQLGAVDPLAVGWGSEYLNSRCGARLKELAHLLEEGPEPDAAALAEFVVEDYSGGLLRPETLRVVFEDAALTVRRAADAPAEKGRELDSGERPVQGRAGLAAELARLVAPLWGSGEEAGHDAHPHFHYKFKIIRVEEHEEGVRTDAYYAADGESKDHLVEQSATWRVEWTPDAEEGGLLIRSIVVWDHEEVTSREHRPLYSDCTGSVFANAPSFEAQLLPGIDHWRARMIRTMGQPLMGHSAGIAIGDVDGDGLEDFFLCQPGGLPNRLYLNAGDGTVRPGPEDSGANILDFTRSALLIDWDGDGDRDLVAVVGEEIGFFEGDGEGRFRVRILTPAVAITMITAADYDLDGDLDLYATGYATPYDGESWPVPYHDAENGQRNFLLENRGEWVVADVTDEVGLDAHNSRFSFASAWEDYDNDGDQDLYVANDFGRNCLYRNDGGRFTDVAPEAAVEDIAAGMGAEWGDFDGDGWMDILVTSMFSSAGNRVTYHRRFKPGTSGEVRGQYQHHARGNALFANAGDGTFRDVSVETGITMGRWGWGSIFTDFNNDGRLDMVVPNGFLTSTRTKDL